jgi:alanyl-tRNA synthetase
LIIHKGIVTDGRIAKGDTIKLQVDLAARRATARNHTATHILHAVLREVLGDHVKQAGSLVAPDRLRFDFTHFSQIEPETLAAIERKVNQHILQNVATHTDEMAAEEAFQSGATALFEEKYGDRVRVVSLADFSKELCGGTHVQHTGDIGLFKIITETSVAAGVRRIEAMTGEGALASVQQMARTLDETARLLKDNPQNIRTRIEKMLAHQKGLEKEIEALKAKLATQTAADADADVREVKGVKVLARRVEADNPGALRDLVDRFRDRLKSGVVVLGCVSGAKALLIAGVTKDLRGRFHAGNIIKALAPMVGGGGGGKPDLAQAGGSQPENLDQALAQAYDVVAGMG